MVCKKNGIEILHHILSPSSRLYIAGEHNKSVLNSCPLHNHGCHIGNEAYLYKDENITKLLDKTYLAQIDLDHVFDELDKTFLEKYKHLYSVL